MWPSPVSLSLCNTLKDQKIFMKEWSKETKAFQPELTIPKQYSVNNHLQTDLFTHLLHFLKCFLCEII